MKKFVSTFLFYEFVIGITLFLAACGSDDPIDLSGSSAMTGSENASSSASNDAETLITTSGGPVEQSSSSANDNASEQSESSSSASESTSNETASSASSASSNSSTSSTNTTQSLPGTGGPFAPGVNCDLGGNWRGIYYNDVTGESESIRATVTRTGLDIIIRTTRSAPPGQLFTGSVNGQCGISVLDAFDGEDWTTKFGGADANQIRIADFVLEDRDPLTGRDPLNIIELVR